MRFVVLLTVAWLSTVYPSVAGSPQSPGPDGPGSFSIPDLGGQSTTSSGTAETLRVGYGRIRAAAGSTTPSGIAISQFRDSDGVLISEAGVPASEPVQEGRIFAEVNGLVNTGLAIANPNEMPATISFYFTDTSGTRFADGSLELGAHQQTAKFLDQEPFNSGSSVLGTFTFTSSVPVAVVALRGFTNEASEFLMTTLPVAPLVGAPSPFSRTPTDTVYFPHFADGNGWETQVILVNPTDRTITGMVGFLGPGSGTTAAPPVILTLDDGSTGSDFDYSIPPRSVQKFTTSNPTGRLAVGSVRATPSSGNAAPSGLVVFSYVQDGKTVSEAGVPALPKRSAFRAYVEASGMPEQAGSIRSGLAITNTAATSNTVTLEVTRLDGSLAVAPSTLSLPPSGQVARFLDQVFSLPDNFSGVLRVTSTTEVAMVALRLRVNERGELKMTTTSPSNEMDPSTSQDRFFAHLADSGGWSTQFILFSGTAGQGASGTLSFFDYTGQPLYLDTTPPALTEREALEAFYEATGGPNWRRNENWLTDRPISEWEGVTVDDSGRVTVLWFVSNKLTGPIPPELGLLTQLRRLILSDNDLTGPIPPELGRLTQLQELNISSAAATIFAGVRGQLTGPIPPELGALTKLKRLDLGFNELSGLIPPELGALTNLQWLYLYSNELSGPIPPELGALTQLRVLQLSDNSLTGPIPPELGALKPALNTLDLNSNSLTGPIPPELGALTSLGWLSLFDNELSGPIPPELGALTRLTLLQLSGNSLTGPIPPEIGELTKLRTLGLSRNTRMSGALPVDMARLDQLEKLRTVETDLCAPSDADFRDWLVGVRRQRLPICDDPPAVYLTQAVQSRRFPVSLVAGEEALLRVFVRTTAPVRARFYLDGQEVHVAEIPGWSGSILPEVGEGSLAGSANALVPAHVVQPGLELVAEVDPEGTLDPGLGVTRRIPETGRLRVDVRAVPLFDLTVIPFVLRSNPDTSIVERVAAIAADPEGHELLWDTRSLLPIGDLEVTAHESVMVDTDNAHLLLAETRMIHTMEGASDYYMAMYAGRLFNGIEGVAYSLGKASIVTPDSFVIAHELGHNFGLLHAPCGGPALHTVDHLFPSADGSTGVWGYDFREGGLLVSPDTPDVMSRCRRPHWISDYHFTNALGFRWREATAAETPQDASSVRSLLLWGGVDGRGAPFLEPAFGVDAPASLPSSAGDYRIVGRTADGGELFSLAFEMPEVGDGDGRSSFAFAVPVEPGWADELADITLSGPSGSVTLDRETNRPVTVLRNRRTGQIRGILRDSPMPIETRENTASALSQVPGAEEFRLRLDPDVEVLISRGLPDPEDLR